MPGFSSLSEMIPFNAFNQHITLIALYLDKETVNHFTALSRYFENLLNNEKSEFGRRFWKTIAVQNWGIKPFKSERINFKFKQMIVHFHNIKNKVNVHKVPWWRCYDTCENCGMECYPDTLKPWCYDDEYNRYCNCPIVVCDSKYEMIIKNLNLKRERILNKKVELREQLRRLDDKMEELDEKEKSVNSIHQIKKMIPEFEKMKEKARYKQTRIQATKVLKELKKYEAWLDRERPNVNFKDQGGRGLGL